MADSSGFGGQMEGSNFDDFEKLDPLASSGGSADEFNVSSSNIPSNPLDEDLYTATPAAMGSAEPSATQPLLDFGEDTKPVEPAFKKVEPSAPGKPIEPPSPRIPPCDIPAGKGESVKNTVDCVLMQMESVRIREFKNKKGLFRVFVRVCDLVGWWVHVYSVHLGHVCLRMRH